jgi:hypothetical protein
MSAVAMPATPISILRRTARNRLVVVGLIEVAGPTKSASILYQAKKRMHWYVSV